MKNDYWYSGFFSCGILWFEQDRQKPVSASVHTPFLATQFVKKYKLLQICVQMFFAKV